MVLDSSARLGRTSRRTWDLPCAGLRTEEYDTIQTSKWVKWVSMVCSEMGDVGLVGALSSAEEDERRVGEERVNAGFQIPCALVRGVHNVCSHPEHQAARYPT